MSGLIWVQSVSKGYPQTRKERKDLKDYFPYFCSLSIIYWVFAASNWAAPSVVAFLGPKFSMVAGAVLYL